MRARALSVGSVLTMSALALSLVVASPATAPAVASSSGYSIATQRLPDGRTMIARWNPCQTITYRVNATLASSTSSGRVAAIHDVQGAFARASAATGLNFRYAGSTTQIPVNTSQSSWYGRETSAEIVVAWVNQKTSIRTNLLGTVGGRYAAGTGGYAYKYWKVGSSPWVGATGRGFVVIDAAQNRSFKPGFGSGATRGALLMHEIGHSLGLLHVGATAEVMYPTVLPRSRTAYAPGDLAGLHRLGRAAGCINTPSWVWSNLS